MMAPQFQYEYLFTIYICFVGEKKTQNATIKTPVILGNIRNPCQPVLLSTVKFAYAFS